MVAAGLNVSMPTSSNNYTMMIDNPYITMYNQANELLNDMKSSKVSKEYVKKQLQQIEKVKTEEVKVDQSINALSKSAPKKSLTNDIYKYDAGKGKYLTYINGKGYSQYSYLNKSGKYALIDRKNEKFDLMMDDHCRMHLLNSKALYIDKIKQINAQGLLFHFTNENEDEIIEILNDFDLCINNKERKINKNNKDWTFGYFGNLENHGVY